VPTRLALTLVESIARQLRVFRGRSAGVTVRQLELTGADYPCSLQWSRPQMGCHRHGDLVAPGARDGLGIIHADSTPTPALQGPRRGAGVHSLGLLMLPMTLDMPDEGTPSR
jgi:hypothetical protein